METNFLLLLILNTSFPKKRITVPIGVTTIKKITPIIIGETMEPNLIPNLNHALLSGASNLEFKTPKIKKNNGCELGLSFINGLCSHEFHLRSILFPDSQGPLFFCQ